VRERLMAAKYASIDVCLSPDQLHASNPGRQAGRQAGARAQHQGSERAERAARNKQTQCHGCARAPVRACALARQPAPDSRLCVGRARSPRTLLVGQEGVGGPSPGVSPATLPPAATVAAGCLPP
jgi:hypothetical protein